MKLHLLIYCVCSLCLWTVNSQAATHNVTGPDFLVTDWTRNLTLTCQSQTPNVDRYIWATPGTETKRCDTGTPENVCTFTPRLEDDNHNVTCALLGSDFKPVSLAVYQVTLKYPPQMRPNITIEPSQTEPLKQGDVITCTVSGGKPRVSAVIFYCQHPDYADLYDNVSNQTHTVSSHIIVNTSLATEMNMTCTCSAHWDPEPGRYQGRTNMSFQLEYKATVTMFTVDNTTALTVNETSHSTVTFTCQADGRPPPVLRLYTQDDGSPLIQLGINASTQELLYTIDSVRGEDMAIYRCEADNGFLSPNNGQVTLFVNSAPKMKDNSYSSVNPPELPRTGLPFVLVGYPTPTFNGSYFFENENVMKPKPVQENTFQTKCTRNTSVRHLVNCHVTSEDWETIHDGLYDIHLTNGLGDVSFSFRVEDREPPPPPWLPLLLKIGVPVAVVLIAGSILVIFYIRRRRRRPNTDNKGQRGASNHDHNRTTIPATRTLPASAEVQDKSSSMATLSETGYATADEVARPGRCSTDSKGYATVGDTVNNTSLPGCNNAAPNRRNNIQTPGYEDVELGQLGAPKIKTTPEKTDVVASIPEDSDNAPPTRRNNVQTSGYEDVELDREGAPKVMTTPEKPDVVAPEDVTERTAGAERDVYAKVAKRQKGDNYLSPIDKE